jgi:hypothetical protein
MAKTASSRGRSAPQSNGAAEPPTRRAAEPPAEPESLDQVRDILFGGQMRMVEGRLRGLEERLLQEQAALRTEVGRTLGELDAGMRKELNALAEKLSAERARRVEELKALGADLKEALKGLEKRHGQLEEAAHLADAELRDQVLRQSAALSAEISRVAQQLSGALDRSVAELGTRKLDVAALAAVLGDAAARLSGEAKPAGKGGARS